MTGSRNSNTTDDLLLKLIDHLGNLSVTTSPNSAQSGGNLGFPPPQAQANLPIVTAQPTGPPTVSVGDGHSIHVTNTGNSILSTSARSLHLNNVLITPHNVKNLIYVRQFVLDNNCTIKFDAFGFSAKDFTTRRVLLRCDSTGGEVLRRLVSSNFISYNKEKPPVLCHACQLGKHVRLLFVSSNTVISSCFDIIHSDVWTSPFRVFQYLADGSLSRYKARLVANGSTQLEGIDVDETFSPVVKPGTIQTVLSLATSRHSPVHQLDVKNAFLHGDLNETIYMHQPLGFQDSQHPNYVCLLQRSLYGLKHASRTRFQRFASYITRVGFQHSRCDSSLFIYRQDSSWMFLSQKKYDVEILERAHMVTCNPSRTPIDIESKWGADGDPVSDPTLYRSLAGSLYYFPPPLPIWWLILMRIGLVAQLPGDRPPVTVFFCNNLLSWSSKRQPTLSRSSAEVEYRGVANVVAETCWLRNLLRELHIPLSSATLVYCDNVSVVYLSCNPVQHQRTKHIEIDIHFVRNLVAAGQVRVLHVPSRYQFADIFTMGLPSALFEEFRSSLSVRSPPAPTTGEC
ncbi:ribonuclease H-like domain-containing protein [Tanacetum coccineum]